MSFKDGRIGVGKDPIFPLDISGSCRIDGDLILGGRFSDSQGNPIQLGSGSGATSTPDQNQDGLPSWSSGTISTQGLGVFKGKMDTSVTSLYITGDTSLPSSATGANNTTLGFGTGTDITSGANHVLIGKDAGANITTGSGNTIIGRSAGTNITTGAENVCIGLLAGHAGNSGRNVLIGHYTGFGLSNTNGYNIAIGYDAMQQCDSNPTHNICMGHSAGKYAGGDNSIFIGREAGKSANPVSSNSGNNNIGLGFYTLTQITSGHHNIGIGYYAGGKCGTNSSNVFIGQQAGREFSGSDYNIGIGTMAMYNSAGGHNIALGYSALQGASGTQSHANNIAMGFEALKFVTSGSNNIVIGHQSGVFVTTGGNNITLGKTAGFNITTGNYNVAIGYNSLRTSTTAYSNVSIGPSSGYKLTTGHENVYIGNGAGYSSTTSSKNVFIGMNAGSSNTTGYENVYIGDHAALSSATGQHNTYIGAHTGRAGNGSYNVCMGTHAGRSNTGSSNTFMGVSAGRNGSGSDNVAIGMQARWQGTGSGNIMIGTDTGSALTSGQYNTNVGHNSNKDCTSGGWNAFLGSGSGQFNTTGGYNVCIGNNTNIYNKTGSYNIVIGSNAAHGNSTSVANKSYELYINSHNGYYGENSFIFGYMKMDSNPSFEAAKAFFKTSGNYMYVGHRDDSASYTSYYAIRRDGSTRKTALSGSSIEFKINNAGPTMTMTSTGLGIGTTDPKGLLHIYGNSHSSYSYSGLLRLVSSSSNGSNSGNWSMINFPDSNAASSANENYYMIGRGHQYSDNCLTLHVPTDGSIDMTSTGAVRMMKIQGNGRVGIGTTSPGFPLEISGDVTGPNIGQVGYTTSTAHLTTSGANSDPISLKTSNVIWSQGYIMASSDRRIKENIVDVADNLALEMVRNIPVKYYEYKDKLIKGNEKTIGFIAQEVKEIIPMAVSIQKNIIPNEMRKLENISWEEIKDNSDNIINYKLTTDLSDCSGIKYRFYVTNDPSGNDECKKEIIGNEYNTFTFDTSYNNVFCYGKEVDDFHTLTKEKLFTLNFSATQELDRKVTALETVGILDYNVKILDLYKENEALKARLAKIEAFLGI